MGPWRVRTRDAITNGLRAYPAAETSFPVTTAPQPARRRADNVPLGIGLTVAAILIFGVQDAVSKYLVQGYSPFQLAMMRFWAFALFSLFLVMRQGPLSQAFRSRSPGLQVVRCVLLVVDIWFFDAALKEVPLAELQAITLVYPFANPPRIGD